LNILKIAVNTRFLLTGKLEGIGKVTHECLQRLTRQHPEHQFYFFFDRPFDPRFIYADNVTPLVLLPPARHPFLFYFWFQYRVAAALKKLRPDVFLSFDGMTVLQTAVPRVTVMHDIAFEHYPQDVPYLQRRYYQYFTPRFARVSDKILTVSEFTRQDIVRHYRVPPAKIEVIYNAAGTAFQPIDFERQVSIRQKYAAGEAYFLFVGALQPRKNLDNLFRAFDRFKQETGSEVKMVVVGRRAWKSRGWKQTYKQMKYREEVVFTGQVSEAELVPLYGAAVATVYVPTFEGFGLPIVEAQACRCPVITSRTSAMPEVAGEGALLVDPLAVADISAAMIRVYLDLEVRQQLRQRGQDNLRRFSWDQSASQLLRVLETCATAKAAAS
jgi:glycosyltransferase involved in cell wall biosynthesis